jgi:threonine-phosphate decarboxylase
MKRFTHGGDVFRVARELGLPPSAILDFSASINPLGMPQGVRQAALAALEQSVHYPEPDAASLTAALADHLGLPADNILPGTGSTELLYHSARVLRPRRALLVTPAFSEYERALQLIGTEIDFFALSPEDGFRLDAERLLRRLMPETDVILFANPGNPSGVGVEPKIVEAVVQAVREQAMVAVDEAFIDFSPHLSVMDRVARYSNLYVFRSLTKFYAIPGLRAGYLAGPAHGISLLAASRPPWPFSTVAQAAAEACLREEAYRQQTLQLIPVLRRELAAGLGALGLTVFPSVANYLLARLEEGGQTAAEVAAALRGRGILIRDCANFPPLDARYFRVAVRTAEENEKLLAALREVLVPAAGKGRK